MTREHFLIGVGNWSNHRILLWQALEATAGEVVEMGTGDGSTPFLVQYCKEAGRKLYSYENNPEWIQKMRQYDDETQKIIFVDDWDVVAQRHIHPSVVLVDHAPGERRKIDLQLFAHKASIIVAHDTEPAADHGYQMRAVLKTFKYMKDYESNGAWATMVSNFVDLSQL